MILVSQDRDVIVNFENVDAIGFKTNDVEKKTIVAHLIGGNSVELATYETEERTIKAFKELINYIVDSSCKIYYMLTEETTE